MTPVTLTGNDPRKKREQILKYFNDSYETFEKLFDMLKDESVFYKKSEPTRHPMIFYFGHTATFYINKLILSRIINKRINPGFESIFAIGVDEMSWDDLDGSRYDWPGVDEVREYRKKVKTLVQNLIETLPLKLPITQDDPFWIILMGIEHERIHIETSSVLHRQMPIRFIKKLKEFTICDRDNPVVENEMITISEKNLKLGKKEDHHLYGWDNEYGEYNTKVEEFKVSKYLVSNDQFMEFVKDKGYEDERFWDEEGKKFLKNTKAEHPIFWIKEKEDQYLYRTLMDIIPLPLSWPVEVNCLEAQAYLRWKTIKDNITYTLPSEKQFYSVYEEAGIKDIPELEISNYNIDLAHFASAAPVDRFCQNGIFDPIGNVWQWTRTPIHPFEGFKVHPVYDDFSVPTFDGKHNLIKGGSFISTGNEIMKHSRYAFRRHFYQHAGFKYVIGTETIDIKELDSKDNFIELELSKHKRDNKITNIYKHILTLIGDYNHNNALEIGCSIGTGSIELSKKCNRVTGVDTTARIIKEAEDTLKGYKNITNIEYWQVDPCNMKPHFKDYDLIVINDILNRIYSPISLLQTLHNKLNNNGIVITITQLEDDVSRLDDHFTIENEKIIENKKITLWRKI
jgi:5-histidylcysteine sulfoxide synthase